MDAGLLRMAAAAMDRGEPVVLVTQVAVEGPAPLFLYPRPIPPAGP